MFTFIHTSDLHLGKRFGNFSGDLPARLREARHLVLAKLAAHARAHNASHILLAGDTFDNETPAADVRRHALAEMASHPNITWVILPGNHDSLQAIPLWDTLSNEVADNIILCREPHLVELAPQVVLLPAPCTTRKAGRDLTKWMDSCPTADATIRIGLAHGPVYNFCENGTHEDVIAPHRAEHAGLDYLALGDWHARLEINPRTYYSGSPEPDRFKHNRPGEALLVKLKTPGAPIEVISLLTASFNWLRPELSLLENEDVVLSLDRLLPTPSNRRQTLMCLVARGYIRLNDRAKLRQTIEQVRPDFATFKLEDTNLATLYATQDLDLIDQAGALRTAANCLMREAEDENLTSQERAIAAAALTRLYFYAQENHDEATRFTPL